MGFVNALPSPPPLRPAFFDDDRRACRDVVDPNVFFPEKKGGRAARAREICGGCAVRVDCREWGIAYEVAGVWGGMSAEERDQERRRRAGAQDRNCEICAEPYVPRRSLQRACGPDCARRLTNRGSQ